MTPRLDRSGDRTPAMGDGGPCLSCGGNDGYGEAPHHTPDCYFANCADVDSDPVGELEAPFTVAEYRAAALDEEQRSA